MVKATTRFLRRRDKSGEKKEKKIEGGKGEKEREKATLARPGTYAYTSENGYVIRRN